MEDRDNAAVLLLDALANWDETRKDAGDDRSYLNDNADSLARIRAARSKTACDWGFKLKSSGFNVLLPHVRNMRRLVRNLSDVAERQHRLGDDAAAIETIRDLRAMARNMDKGPTTLLNHLVSISIHEVANSELEKLAPALNVIRQSSSLTTDMRATHEQVRTLIGELLQEQPVRDGIVHAFQSERGIYQLDVVLSIFGGKIDWPGPIGGYASQELANRTKPRTNIDTDIGANASGAEA